MLRWRSQTISLFNKIMMNVICSWATRTSTSSHEHVSLEQYLVKGRLLWSVAVHYLVHSLSSFHATNLWKPLRAHVCLTSENQIKKTKIKVRVNKVKSTLSETAAMIRSLLFNEGEKVKGEPASTEIPQIISTIYRLNFQHVLLDNGR